MLNLLLVLAAWFFAFEPNTLDDCNKCLLLCEQSQHRVVLVDLLSKQIAWEWNARSSNIAQDHIKWFDNPDEAKAVYNNKFVLITASGGGVALIRISDKKVIFYAYAGGNPHSAELLPDGNIVTASSTGGFLKLFKVDTLTFPDKISPKSYPIVDGHNVVWDKKRQVLWAGSGTQLYAYRYNADCQNPALTLRDSITLPANLHDLFPIYGKDALWLSTDLNVFSFDISAKKFEPFEAKFPDHIKSLSSGPTGYPVLMIHPKEKWWTDEVISSTGESIFKKEGLRIYKGRWFLENHFSYPEDHGLQTCQR